MAGKVGNEARSGELTRELDEDDEVFRGFLMKNHLGEMVSILEASDPTLFYSLSIEYVGQSLVIYGTRLLLRLAAVSWLTSRLDCGRSCTRIH